MDGFDPPADCVPSLGCLCADTLCAALVLESRSRTLDASERAVFGSVRQLSASIASRCLANCVGSGLVDEALFGPELLDLRFPCAHAGSELAELSARCPSCAQLELVGFDRIHEEAWAKAAQRLPLKRLLLDGTRECPVGAAFLEAVASVPTLTDLDLRATVLEDGAVDSLCRSVGPALRHIRLDFSRITAACVGELVQRATALVSLRLAGSKELHALPDLPPTVECLELFGCTSVSAADVERAVTRAVRRGCLTHLGLAEHAVTDDILAQWTREAEQSPLPSDDAPSWAAPDSACATAADRVAARPASCPATAAAGPATEADGPATSAPISAAAASVSAACGESAVMTSRLCRLAYLDLSWNDRASPAAVMRLLRGASRLQQLRLRCTGTDSDAAFADEEAAGLAAMCPALRWLSLTRWDTVGDATAAALSGLPSLTHLDLSWSQALSDAGVAALLSSPSCRLCFLGLEGCKGISERGVTGLGRHPGSGRLREVRLDWVNAAGAEQVATVRADLPGARVFDYYGQAEPD